MKRFLKGCQKLMLVSGCLALAGCQSMPKDLLVLPQNYLSERQQQMRKYATVDEKKVIQASAGALQDLGFTIDKSEMDLGMVVSSKNRTAVSPTQVTTALTLDAACLVFGCYSNIYGKTDKAQKIQASVMINPALAKDSTVVRVKFQTVVWSVQGYVSRFETIKDPKIYQDFFERVSKSIFLEEQKI
jgi:hypothetical protein